MSIIDKLGIQQIKQFECIGRNGLRKNAVCETSEVRELEQQRNEILEALIGLYITTGQLGIVFGGKNPAIKVIEKITDKSWEEILDLIKIK